MITDIPTKKDFFSAGSAYLNMTWERVLEFVEEPDEDNGFTAPSMKAFVEETNISWQDEAIEQEQAEKIAYAELVKRELAICVGLALQGIEFILKGRIASVSPFLLLAGGGRDWPKECRQKDTPFSMFRTIPAEDLPKVHDAVHKSRLSDKFIQRYNDLRSLRNKLTHSVIKDFEIQCKDVLIDLLELSLCLNKRSNWMQIRKSYRSCGPHLDYSIAHHCSELHKVINLFSPAECKRYFGVEKKRRKYICYECFWNADKHVRDLVGPLAFLIKPDTKCNELFCPICVATYRVKRKACAECEVKAAVFADDGACLSCR